jgi:hypothetical protein
MKVIIDQIGRTVVGEVDAETTKVLSLIDPVIIHVQPGPDGKLQVQTIPYIFVEFVDKDNRDKNVWHFNKSQIVLSDVVLDEKIASAAANINKVMQEQPDTPGDEANTVKLFDE